MESLKKMKNVTMETLPTIPLVQTSVCFLPVEMAFAKLKTESSAMMEIPSTTTSVPTRAKTHAVATILCKLVKSVTMATSKLVMVALRHAYLKSLPIMDVQLVNPK
jgi:hypothetical protein